MSFAVLFHEEQANWFRGYRRCHSPLVVDLAFKLDVMLDDEAGDAPYRLAVNKVLEWYAEEHQPAYNQDAIHENADNEIQYD